MTNAAGARFSVRFATDSDADAIAALHAARIAEGFLVTLGPTFLRRLYRRIIRADGAFVLVVDDPEVDAGAGARRVCGFVAVAQDTGALYRDFLVRDGVVAGVAAIAGIARNPGAVWETARYGLRGERDAGAEVLATAVAVERAQQGIASLLVTAATEELRRRGVGSARVVTTVGNLAAVKAYERGGFRPAELVEVHRGVTQQLLVWP